MSDELKALWESTANLHKRFFPDSPPTFEARFRVFYEEIAELNLALMDISGNEPDVAKEAADVFVTTIGLLQWYGIPLDVLQDAIQFVAKKNDAKTLDTHEIRADGKIARRKV